MDRRRFISTASLAGLATTIAGAAPLIKHEAAPGILNQKPNSKLNLGFIGVGLRGRNHVELALERDDCEVFAICDIDPQALEATQNMLKNKGKKPAFVYGTGDRDYQKLLSNKDVDAIVIATPWVWHTEMAVEGMKAGKYVATEVSGAFSVDDCWRLVNTHEDTGKHLFFLENVCYRRDVMAVLNMVRKGMFGELLHLEGGYQHDLRGVKFNDGKDPYGSGVEFGDKGISESKWRTLQSIHRNGELYPTHGIGPVSNWININRGNRFAYLTSTSSKALGLHDYIVNHPKGGSNHPNAAVNFKLGDVVTTVIKCANGETVILSHDTNLPRPYSLGFRVQGTKGIWMDVNESLMIEGVTKPHEWNNAATFLQENDHPLWKKYEHLAEGAGHGGMDWFVFNSFIHCAKNNIAPPIDVYDAATWRAITPLSEQSIATGSTPQPFPDFTRGGWTTKSNHFAENDVY